MTAAGGKDPLTKGYLPGRSTQNEQCARRLAPGLAHGAAVREPTPGFPAPPSRLRDARTRDRASHTTGPCHALCGRSSVRPAGPGAAIFPTAP